MKAFLLLAVFLTSTDLPVQVEQKVPEAKKLSWEAKNPARSEWTKVALDKIRENFDRFDSAEDVGELCPNYKNLEKEEKVWVWGELISTMAFYESGWKPTAQLQEPTLGIDRVTGGTVTSEGLLQMSYGDTKWAPFCEYDWAKDKKLGSKDPKKTIFEPKNNLECGIQVLANQIGRSKKLFLGKGAYWSVIKTNSRYQKIKEIKTILKALPACRVEKEEC